MSSFRPDRVLLIVIAVIVIGWTGVNAAVWWPQLVDETPVYLEPQGNVRAVLADAWRTEGRPAYDLSGPVADDRVIALLPRDGSIVDQSLVPKDFAYPVALAAATSVGGASVRVLLSLLGGLLAAALVGLITWELTRHQLASWVGVVLALTSVIWWAGSYGGVSLSFFGVSAGLASALVLLRYRDRRLPLPSFLGQRFFIAGVLTGVAVGFHYATFPWWSSVLLASCVGVSQTRRSVVQRIAWAAAGGAAALVPVMLFNAWVYGSPTVTGYSEFATVLDAVGWQSGGIGFSPQAAIGNLGVYLARPEILPLLVTGAYAHRLADQEHLPIQRQHVLIVGAGSIFFVGVASSSPLWGTGTFLTNASMLRYLAPVMALVIIATAIGFAVLWDSENVVPRVGAVVLAGFCVGVNATTVLWQPNGMADTRRLLDATAQQQEAVLAVVPEDGLVMTRRLDKVFFPHRVTVTASYLVTETPASSGVLHLYDTLPDADEILAFIDVVNDRPIFIFNDTGWVPPSSQARISQVLGLSDRCLTETDVDELFEIGRCQPAPRSSSE